MANVRRKIAVFTTSRSEYGLLRYVLKEIAQDNDLELLLIVGGSHLSHELGYSLNEILHDGFTVHETVEMTLASDTALSGVKSCGLALLALGDIYKRHQPDLLLVLGDRYELIPALTAAVLMHVPVAHIHGGETTLGAVDDRIRHAVTKLSDIHFPAAPAYAQRIIQMGEDPKCVYCFGAPGLDHLIHTPLLTKTEIERALAIKFTHKNFLITYHSVTSRLEESLPGLQNLLNALKNYPDVLKIFTGSNADEQGREINQHIKNFVKNQPNCIFFDSLGIQLYLSMAKQVDVIIGNSSSGIIEIPFLKKPTVNIGSRQATRLKTSSILDCTIETEDIIKAIETASSRNFIETQVKPAHSPYKQGNGHISQHIKNVLKTVNLSSLKCKRFNDIGFDYATHQSHC